MSWTLRSTLVPELYVTYDERGGWSADDATTERLEATGPYVSALLTPLGPSYESRGSGDQVALYLNARACLPGESEVIGDPPEVPQAPAVPEGAVS